MRFLTNQRTNRSRVLALKHLRETRSGAPRVACSEGRYRNYLRPPASPSTRIYNETVETRAGANAGLFEVSMKKRGPASRPLSSENWSPEGLRYIIPPMSGMPRACGCTVLLGCLGDDCLGREDVLRDRRRVLQRRARDHGRVDDPGLDEVLELAGLDVQAVALRGRCGSCRRRRSLRGPRCRRADGSAPRARG